MTEQAESDGGNVFPFRPNYSDMGAEGLERIMKRPLKEGGGDGTSGGMSDDWKVSVDTQLGQLHTDVRQLLWAGLVACGIFIAAFFALYDRVGNVEVKQAMLIEKAEGLQKQIDKVDGKLDAIEGKLDKLLDQRRK